MVSAIDSKSIARKGVEVRVLSPAHCRGGEIGIRARFRYVWSNPWEFKSPPRHMYIGLILIGILFGFIISQMISGKHSGEKGMFGSLKISLSNKKYLHIHHWLIALSFIIFYKNFLPSYPFIFGLLFGSFIQGLTYKDFYRFVYEK